MQSQLPEENLTNQELDFDMELDYLVSTGQRLRRGGSAQLCGSTRLPGPVLLDINPDVVYNRDALDSIDIFASTAPLFTGPLLDTSWARAQFADVNNSLLFNNINGPPPVRSQLVGIDNETQICLPNGVNFGFHGPYRAAANDLYTPFDITAPVNVVDHMVDLSCSGMNPFGPTQVETTADFPNGNINLSPGDTQSHVLQGPPQYQPFPPDMDGMMPVLPMDMSTAAVAFPPNASAFVPGAQSPRIPCTICLSTFKRDADRIRHENSVHNNAPGAHLCPVVGCTKSHGRGFSRADKVTEHCWKQHGNLGYSKRT